VARKVRASVRGNGSRLYFFKLILSVSTFMRIETL
jgi:hypothetical protein